MTETEKRVLSFGGLLAAVAGLTGSVVAGILAAVLGWSTGMEGPFRGPSVDLLNPVYFLSMGVGVLQGIAFTLAVQWAVKKWRA